MNPEQNKSPEQLEREIAMTRGEMETTLSAIQNRLSPDRLMHQAVDYVREGAGGYASNLGATIKNNPVPFTLLGFSLAWLMLSSGRTPRHVEYDDEFTAEPSGPGTMERIGSGISGAKTRIGDSAHSVAEGMSGAKARISDSVHGFADKARSASEWARGKKTSARVTAGQWTQDARDGYHRARYGVETTYNDYPLILGAFGIALGAAIGASLPSTRREDQWMGQASDDLVSQTKRVVRDEFDKNRDKIESVAEKAAEAAKEEARNQDLTGANTGP
ncbi:MAG: DUF3618 domain-containing protein [Burkholderiales bacterium]